MIEEEVTKLLLLQLSQHLLLTSEHDAAILDIVSPFSINIANFLPNLSFVLVERMSSVLRRKKSQRMGHPRIQSMVCEHCVEPNGGKPQSVQEICPRRVVHSILSDKTHGRIAY